MNSKSLSKRKIFVLVVLGLVAIRFLFFRAPSEAEMLTKFHRHKAEFEQIRLMLQQDKNVRTISPDWVTPEWDGKRNLPLNVSDSRVALYRARLRKLGFSRVDSYDGRVQFGEFGGGFTDTTWGIGYMWSAQPPTPLVKSAYSAVPNRDKWHFSRIEGNWYLYHRR